MDSRPFTVAALAERWQCLRQHVHDLINSGKIACFRLGRLIRIPADEVERIESVESVRHRGGDAAVRPGNSGRLAVSEALRVVVLPDGVARQGPPD